MEDSNRSFAEKMNEWMKKSFTLKLVLIGVLILLLMIPMSMIRDTIDERNSSKWTAINDITSKWGNEQQINGPYLSVPIESTFQRKIKNENDELITENYTSVKYQHFLPEDLDIQGSLFPETRYRGIYDVVVYKSDLKLKGHFKKPNMDQMELESGALSSKVLWEESQLTMGIKDLRGLTENIAMNWDGQKEQFEPLKKTYGLVSSGVGLDVSLKNDSSSKQLLPFTMDIKLNGSNSIRFVPLARQTSISIDSDWPDPKFGGAFLPVTREVLDSGFAANWKILELNRPFPQTFTSSIPKVSDYEVSAELLLPVDEYQKSTRSAKYAILLISLTFVSFFFIQVIKGIRMHPFQYLLVGLALCVFYSLLLSLSEVIKFNPAYGAAGSATILMIGLYLKSVFKNSAMAIRVSGILTVVYSFIFLIIQQQDYALLMGSIGLFLIIAAVMYLSRNVNWYRE